MRAAQRIVLLNHLAEEKVYFTSAPIAFDDTDYFDCYNSLRL